MKVYDVLLAGIEGKKGFFISVEASATSKLKASILALAEVKSRGMTGMKLEEVEIKARDGNVTKPIILRVYGKSYFPLDN